MFSRIALSTALKSASRSSRSFVQPTRAALKIGETRGGVALSTKFDLPDPGRFCPIRGTKGIQLTKIVATIGPTSEQLGPLTEVCENGLSVMRLNFSHATTEEVELRLTNLEAAEVSLENVKNYFPIICHFNEWLFHIVISKYLLLYYPTTTKPNPNNNDCI